MNRAEYEEAKRMLEEISVSARDERLSPSERDKLKILAAGLSGQLMSIWIPFGWERRTIMVVLLLLGLYGLFSGHFYWVFAWVLILLFSPRAVGNTAYLIGKISRS